MLTRTQQLRHPHPRILIRIPIVAAKQLMTQITRSTVLLGWNPLIGSPGHQSEVIGQAQKYARTDCLDAQDSNLSSACACRYFQDCHNALNAELMEKCRKYTAPGEICAGITPAPSKAPLEDCLAEHLDEIDVECLDVYTRHEANRL